MSLLFYVNGHGYGHATRMAEVMQAVAAIAPSTPIHVRTAAPPRLFPTHCRIRPVAIDSHIHESADSLRIDLEATLNDLRMLLEQRGGIMKREAEFIAQNGVRLIVADVPFLAGSIGKAAGVPCIGIGNFTWNWILKPHFTQEIEDGYRHMQAFWRLPFSHSGDLHMFGRVDATPLIVPGAGLLRAEARALLGLPAGNAAPVILVGFRGRLPVATLQNAARQSPEFTFLSVDPAHASGLRNAHYVELTSSMSFQSVANASDVVVSKLGYGTVAGCVAEKKRLMYPLREGFPEDEILEEASEYTCLRRALIDRFNEGDWRECLVEVLDAPMPSARLSTDGAQTCARRIIRLIS